MSSEAECPAARARFSARTSCSSRRIVVEMSRAIHSPYNERSRKAIAADPDRNALGTGRRGGRAAEHAAADRARPPLLGDHYQEDAGGTRREGCDAERMIDERRERSGKDQTAEPPVRRRTDRVLSDAYGIRIETTLHHGQILEEERHGSPSKTGQLPWLGAGFRRRPLNPSSIPTCERAFSLG